MTPIAITVEGANILTRTLIIFGQGAIRAHPYVLREMRAAKEMAGAEASREFDDSFTSHIGHVIRFVTMGDVWRAANQCCQLVAGPCFGEFV